VEMRMNLPNAAALILISVGCIVSCSDTTGDSVNAPTGGTSSLEEARRSSLGLRPAAEVQ